MYQFERFLLKSKECFKRETQRENQNGFYIVVVEETFLFKKHKTHHYKKVFITKQTQRNIVVIVAPYIIVSNNIDSVSTYILTALFGVLPQSREE